MSKLSDYSKFDHLVDSDDEAEQQQQQQTQPTPRQQQQLPPSIATTLQQQQQSSTSATSAAPTPTTATQRKDPNSGRFIFEYNGRPVYEWEQKLEEVTIFVTPPPFVQKGNQIICQITATHLKLGLVGANNQWFLNEDTFGLVDVSESTWSLEDSEEKVQSSQSQQQSSQATSKQKIICIYLIKAQKGVLWDSALKGNTAASVQLDPASQEQVRKDLLLERFQEENPGFDFRDAEFNGSVPDARTFMGGVKYQ